jgi:hypothetical protein
MDVLCKSRHDQIRIYISCYTSRPVVTAACQVSPFREHGIHCIQANIVYRVDTNQCDLFGTLLGLSSRGKPCICTAPGPTMFVPSFSNNRHSRCTAACFRELCGFSPGSLSKAAPRFVSISCILCIGHVSESTHRTKQPFENTYLNSLRLLLEYLKTIYFVVLQSLKILTCGK